ncbi:MAG TPA: protein translocase subunit SecF [Actinomycetota bacterium]|nr:protein translocase subunit SecF [Actinomycetota bacterium]
MMRRLRRGGFTYDFVGKTKRWLLISAAIMVLSIGSLAVRRLNLGLEFKGGTSFQVEAKQGATVDDFERIVEEAGIDEPVVQKVGQRGFLVQTEHLKPEKQTEVKSKLAREAGVPEAEVNVTDVGPRWGQQITAKALRALLAFLVVVTLYISLRFEPKMAGSALLALVHDLIATAGIYALIGFVVTPATVIALLTILGYSLYDTVIIFDRVRERSRNLSAAGKQTYSDIANESLNQVLVRSLNTSLVSLLPVGSLLFVGSYLLGAETLRELALALFLGIAVGAYSSVFLAVPVLAAWKERETRWSQLRARIAARQAEPSGPRFMTTPAAPVQPAEPEAVSSSVGTPSAGRPQHRPPKPRPKKRKRRR